MLTYIDIVYWLLAIVLILKGVLLCWYRPYKTSQVEFQVPIYYEHSKFLTCLLSFLLSWITVRVVTVCVSYLIWSLQSRDRGILSKTIRSYIPSWSDLWDYWYLMKGIFIPAGEMMLVKGVVW